MSSEEEGEELDLEVRGQRSKINNMNILKQSICVSERGVGERERREREREKRERKRYLFRRLRWISERRATIVSLSLTTNSSS